MSDCPTKYQICELRKLFIVLIFLSRRAVAFEVEVPAPGENKTGSSSDDASGSFQNVSVVNENDGGHVDTEEAREEVAVREDVRETTKPEGNKRDSNVTVEGNVNGKCQGQGYSHKSDVTEKQNRGIFYLKSKLSQIFCSHILG